MSTKQIKDLVALADEMERCGCGGACGTCSKSQDVFGALSEEDREEIDSILEDESTRNNYREVQK